MMNSRIFKENMKILSLVMVMILVFGSISFAGVFDPNNNNGNGWGSDIYNHIHVMKETVNGFEIVGVNYVIENDDNYVEMDKNDKNNPDVGGRVFSSKTQQNNFTGESVFTISVDIKLADGSVVTEVFTVTNVENYNDSGYTYYEYSRINWIENTKGLVFYLNYEVEEEPTTEEVEEPTTEAVEEPTTEEVEEPTTEEVEEPTTEEVEEPTTEVVEEPTTEVVEEPTTEEPTTEEITTPEEITTDELPLDNETEEPTTEEEVEEIETNEIPLDNGKGKTPIKNVTPEETEELEELEDEEIPLDNGVKTGDNTSPIIYITLMIVVVIIGGVVLVLGRKRNEK